MVCWQGDEGELNECYQRLYTDFARAVREDVAAGSAVAEYTAFDFHAECKCVS